MRSRLFPVAAIAVACGLMAQEQPAPAGGGGGGNVGGGGGNAGGGGNVGGGGGGVGGREPGGLGQPGGGRQQQQGPFDPNQQRQFPEMERPIFLSGKVVMEDGTPPPDQVVIERVCNGQPRPEGYTDSKGRFSIQLGQNQSMMQDASYGSVSNDPFGGGQGGGFGGQPRSMGGGGMMNSRANIERELMGCELQAKLAGFRSEVVNLAGRRMMDNPDVGTIILRRLANVEGLSTSMTTLMAPKDARKAYEKGIDQIKKKKLDEAQKEMEKAVGLYPKYAVAWYDLGRLHQQANRVEEARKAYGQALAADSKYVNPYMQLALLAANEQKWGEVAEQTGKLVKLNPIDFPQAFFYNAVANYNLQKMDEAESSAREAVKLDNRHRMPKAQHVLGVILAQKNDFEGAASNMRDYLKFAPAANDADMVKKQLAEIEKRLGKGEVAAETEKQQ